MSTEEKGTEQKSSQELAREKEERSEQAKKDIEELEQADELPGDISEWPSGPAKYETFGKDDDAYGDGATEKLGPANLERHADGSVSIDGEKVDNPDWTSVRSLVRGCSRRALRSYPLRKDLQWESVLRSSS